MGKHVRRRHDGLPRKDSASVAKESAGLKWDGNPSNSFAEEKALRAPISRRSGGGRVFFYLGVVLLLAAVALLAAVYTFFTGSTDPFSQTGLGNLDRPVNILVMGVDSGIEGFARSDTMMLVSLSPGRKGIDILSIPRDTRVQIPGRAGWYKINAAFAYGGPKLAARTVGNLLGVRVDHYLLMDFEGFARMIDTLGGVTIQVDKPMDYDDNAQNLHIHLKEGRRHLNGKEALGYVRFRGDGLGDISLVDPSHQVFDGRVERQHRFIRAVSEQIFRPGAIAKVPALLSQLGQAVQSDMPKRQMLQYGLFARRMGPAGIRAEVLPGIGQQIDGVSYWVPDLEAVRRLSAQLRSGASAGGAKGADPMKVPGQDTAMLVSN
ncbi:MAG: LCP family protein [Syntrophothermus sp.]